MTEKIRFQTSFFLENLKAVCLSFNWVPKLIQKSFQTWEPQFVQRCKTKVGADACKGSYVILTASISCVVPPKIWHLICSHYVFTVGDFWCNIAIVREKQPKRIFEIECSLCKTNPSCNCKFCPSQIYLNSVLLFSVYVLSLMTFVWNNSNPNTSSLYL